MMTRNRLSFRLCSLSLWALSVLLIAGETAIRPPEWAQPLRVAGCPNLHKVSDELYRGAQPEKPGYAELRRRGIRTVVNLRQGEDWEQKEVEREGMRYVSLSTNTFFPRKKKFQAFLSLFEDPQTLPVFVHCRHGADRTGAAVALYRIMRQNWSIEDAWQEMTRGGFGFHSIHSHLIRFIRSFVRHSKKQLPQTN